MTDQARGVEAARGAAHALPGHAYVRSCPQP